MAAPTLRFYFDYISPYSYLAWQELPALASRHAVAVEPTPVLFAALLDEYGHKGPAEIAPKRMYMFKECLRRAASLGVPMRPPHSHPFNPLPALRATSLEMSSEQRASLITALFAATWAEGRDVSSPEVVAAAAESVGVRDVVARVRAPEVKSRFKAMNAEAVQHGVFGVPTLLVGEELFWGNDSLPHVEAFLEGRDLLEGVDLASWQGIRATAKRREPRNQS